MAVKIKIHVIEDSPEFHEAIEYEMIPKLAAIGIDASFIFKEDGDTIEQDLVAGCDVMVIDDDLGDIYGDEIIEKIDSFPEYKNLPIVYYSGGESIERLEEKTKNFGRVKCTTKSGLADKILKVCERFL